MTLTILSEILIAQLYVFFYYTGCQGIVSQEFQGKFIRENVDEHVYTVFE
jgi:hypothetical protein